MDEWVAVNLGGDDNFIAALAGRVTGHPRLRGTRRLIMTSPLRAVDLQERWVRTEGRFCRLGEPRDFSYDELLAMSARFKI